MAMFPEVRWARRWPHKAEVRACRGGMWRLTVELQPHGKPFAWTVCHTTGLPRRAGECSKLDFAIYDAERTARELDAEGILAKRELR